MGFVCFNLIITYVTLFRLYDVTVPKITSVRKIKCVLYNESIYTYTMVMPLASPEDKYSTGGTAPHINLGIGLRVGRSGIRIPEGQEIRLLTRTSRRALDSTQPCIQLVLRIFHDAKAARK